MASGQHADALKLTPRELRRPGERELPGAPIVHVEAVEEEKPGSPRSPKGHSESKEEAHHHRTPPITHETETVKTTVSEEEEFPSPKSASVMDKVKGKVQLMGDKLRPHNAVHAKEEDPHPSLT